MQRELAALQRELREQAALAEQQRDEDSTRSLVDWWRHLAVAPPDTLFYQEALSRRPLPADATLEAPQQQQLSLPLVPPLATEEARLAHLAQVTGRHLQATPTRALRALGPAIAVAGVFALAGVIASVPALVAIGAGLAVLVFLVTRTLQQRAAYRAMQSAVTAEVSMSWPRIEADLVANHRLQVERIHAEHQRRCVEAEAAYRQSLEEYQRAQAATQARWENAEAARIQLLQQLLRGDPATSDQVLSDVIAAIDFPFEADIDIAIPDEGGNEVRLFVDLPEIEDSIPETKVRALKNGTTKSVKRTAAERYALYAQLVVGLGVALATQALCVLPAAGAVTVAGYTQRRKRGQGGLEDQFVYELTVPRDETIDLDPETADPLELLQTFECRFDLDARGNLRKISPPAWAAALMGERPRA